MLHQIQIINQCGDPGVEERLGQWSWCQPCKWSLVPLITTIVQVRRDRNKAMHRLLSGPLLLRRLLQEDLACSQERVQRDKSSVQDSTADHWVHDPPDEPEEQQSDHKRQLQFSSCEEAFCGSYPGATGCWWWSATCLQWGQERIGRSGERIQPSGCHCTFLSSLFRFLGVGTSWICAPEGSFAKNSGNDKRNIRWSSGLWCSGGLNWKPRDQEVEGVLICDLQEERYLLYNPGCQPSSGSPSREVVKKVKLRNCQFENRFEDLVLLN